MPSSQKITTTNDIAANHGQNGVVTETGTTAVTGDFIGVLILEACTFTTFTESNGSGDAMTGFSIPAGIYIPGQITALTASSGKFRAYKR